MSTEKTKKLSMFARANGYSDLESLYDAIDYERKQALTVIASWNGVHPTTGEKIKKPKPTPSVSVSNKTWKNTTKARP